MSFLGKGFAPELPAAGDDAGDIAGDAANPLLDDDVLVSRRVDIRPVSMEPSLSLLVDKVEVLNGEAPANWAELTLMTPAAI